MTTPPDFIWLAHAWANTFIKPDSRENVIPYVRRSPTVLAELPEVRALADDLASCIAMIQHSIGAGKDVFIEPDTRKKLSEARDRLEAFLAAAIREGRNG